MYGCPGNLLQQPHVASRALMFPGFKTHLKNPLKNIKQFNKNIFEFEIAKTAQKDRGKNMHNKKMKMSFETNCCCFDSQSEEEQVSQSLLLKSAQENLLGIKDSEHGSNQENFTLPVASFKDSLK